MRGRPRRRCEAGGCWGLLGCVVGRITRGGVADRRRAAQDMADSFAV
jgi:hypothetical protein